MLRKLRVKFVAICMLLVTLLLVALVYAVFLSARENIEHISMEVLRRVIREAPGRYSPDIGGDDVVLPYFTVSIWGDTAYVTGGTYADLDNTEALSAILSDCLSEDAEEGMLPRYGLRYLREENGWHTRVAFVDMSMESATLREIFASYLLIALISLLPLLGVSVLLSQWAVAPVERAWKQQRQFLSDASHELKTPLTVILSNAELFEGMDLAEKPRRWMDNILSEARRMKSLVEEMLTLARADQAVRATAFADLSLSDLAADCALAFEPVAFEAGKPLRYEIVPDATVSGDREKLRRLISVLLDNAIKYGADDGAITLTLEKTDRQARLTVSNPNGGAPIPQETLSHLFERFYRGDTSRGEQSGFGLGLSIADSIAREHRGTLRAESDQDGTRFLYTMSLKKQTGRTDN